MKPRIMCGILGLVVALSSSAWAGTNDEADALIAQGVALREQGKDDQALEVFRRAEAKSKTPRATAQVALAEQALGMWVLAETHLTAALEAKDDPWIQKNRGPLEGALATIQKHVGSLDVRSNVGNAEVYVDGSLAGTLPRPTPLRVEVGPRQVEVRAPGHHPVSRTVSVSVDGMSRETFTLAPLPEEPKVVVVAPRGRDPVPTRPAAEPSNVPRTVGWVLVGTGVGLAAFGGVGMLVAEIQTGRYNDRKDCPGANVPTQPGECQSILDTRSTWRTVGVGAFVGAGVLTLAGAAFVLLSPSAKPGGGAEIACAPSLGSPGLACTGRF
ncbi:MAG: PEGA domain-containing protein [Polyangiaceae bacterium]